MSLMAVTVFEGRSSRVFVMWAFQAGRRATGSPRGGARRRSATGAQPRPGGLDAEPSERSDGHRGRCRGTGPDGRARALRRSRQSTDRCRAPRATVHGFVPVGADVEFDVAVEHGRRQPPDRLATEPSASQMPRRVRSRVPPGAGTAASTAHRSSSVDRTADRLDDSARHRSGAGDRDLLADHCPHCGLEGVDARRCATTGRAVHESREHRVGAERRIDGDRVTVEIEQPPDPLHRGGEVRPRSRSKRAAT